MLSEMRTFVLFAEEGSIQRVAERLPLTQPAVTRQIQRLERLLGFELLDRRLKPPTLAPLATEALARCRKVLAAYDEFTQMARQREPEGMLRLGVAHGIAGSALAPIIRDLRRRFPNVMLRLITGWSQPLSEQLARGNLDAAVLLSAEVVSHRLSILGKEYLSIITASAETAGKADGSIAEAGWILSPEPCDARRLLASAMVRRGQALQVVAEVQDSGLQLALVREGLGLSLLPRRFLERAAIPGIAALEDADDLRLVLDVQMQRSPHLRLLDPVVDILAQAIGVQLGDGER
ncbi:LysR family transcriptional regulator [Labrys sp. LIt4]|uniref:LysR family transcriptional regulator n=1 Tax=Labrys sp. LIt4 TaxID=2821355 RepID=UPI001ADF9762|nr:LysR family transcriptional regulator [Labrys sp. LIt4]MBP0582967.1 LysR family transcriptional regulator [Labrys sp. LIt4]